jgi:hypothetical protein
MTTDFNNNPYFDDFDSIGGAKENNYMRILFKPGYSVQARELTQLQTQIQNQIKLFGDHIFQDGSPVIGGHLTFDNSSTSIKLQNQYLGEDIFVNDFLNKVIINDSGAEKKRAYVIAVDDTRPNKTLMVRYLRGTEFTDGETLKIIDNFSKKAQIVVENSQTLGSTVSINEGVFYVDGFFVQVPEQTIILEPYSRSPTYKIGLEIEDEIIDASIDAALLDPAQGAFNYQAPGADRYKFALVLAKRELESTDDSKFFELLRVENGIITKQVKYPIYSELEKTFARRTFDESGNYTVTPFKVSAAEHDTDNTKFNVEVGPGKAYVKGFEFETLGTTKIPVNKARTVERVRDYDLSLEFGNYVTVKNLFSGSDGIFASDSYATLDLHIVPSANINTSSALAYSSTKIGTTKIRSIQRADDTRYYAFILDQETSSNTFTPAAATSTSVQFPTSDGYSIENDAYNGASISIVSGPGAGQSRRISDYNGSTKEITVDRAFDPAPTTGSTLSINYSFEDTKSIVVAPASYATTVYGTKNVANAVYPCMDIDSSGQTSTGRTFIERSKFNKLIYALPENFIDRTSFSNVDFYHRKLLTSRNFVDGNNEIDTETALGESIYYGTNGTFLSPAQANTNVLVLVKNKGTSNAANGELINLNAVNAGVVRVTNSKLRIQTAKTGNFTADVYVNVKMDDSESKVRKTKTLKGDPDKIALDVSDVSASATAVTGDSNIKVNLETGIVWVTNYSNVVKTPGQKQSLYLSDVVKVSKVFDSGNPSNEPTPETAIDITENYLFDSGQRDNYYDHASIILRDGAAPPVGQIAIVLSYYDHGATAGYATGQSYEDGYRENNLVPVYSSSLVPSISLADAIDFRPVRNNLTTAKTYSGLRIPYTDLAMELSYSYYVPRIDKIAVADTKDFKVITGIPSKYPLAPEDDPSSMTLYTVYIPPYTSEIKDVKFKFHENKRYTMRDIGILENRINRVEYYTQLSLLEKEARNDTYLYEDGVIEKEKYGILVDQFDGFNIADNKNPDLLCNISFNNLSPYKKITPLKLRLDSIVGTIRKNERTYSLAYSEEPAVTQSTATKAISVQPYLFASFQGEIELRPEIDNWVSEVQPPDVVTENPVVNNRPPTERNTTPAAAAEPTQIVPRITIPETRTTVQSPANSVGFETPLFNDNTRSRDSSLVNNVTQSINQQSVLPSLNLPNLNLDLLRLFITPTINRIV